jgi:hypothetical protein
MMRSACILGYARLHCKRKIFLQTKSGRLASARNVQAEAKCQGGGTGHAIERRVSSHDGAG